MSSSGSSDLAKGKRFLKHLLYVQHVDKEKDTASTVSEISLREYFLGHSNIFSDSNFVENLRNPTADVGILKSCLEDKICQVLVYSNPLPATPKTAVTIHAFVVFRTWNWRTKQRWWWSLEKNGQYIVLQQSPKEYDVTYNLYDAEKKEIAERPRPLKLKKIALGNNKDLEYLLRAIWETSQLSTKYHLLFSNCQNFASFVFEKANRGGKKWSTRLSATVDRFGLRKKKTNSISPAELVKYRWIEKDAKFDCYKAMLEGSREDFEELASNLPSEFLNSVDSQGYTLFEWATALSTSDWPIDQFFKEKGAELPTDEGLFRLNVFFIALQYLPSSNKELKHKSQLLSFDGVDIQYGVNLTGESALHLALYGEKWDVAEKILDQFKDYDANTTNCLGDTPLHLAFQLKCGIGLFRKILFRTNSVNVNKPINEYGQTVLHIAIIYESTTAIEELLKHKDVDVDRRNNHDQTALHFASWWKDIPTDLFKKILKKTTDVNAQSKDGCTALHWAIMYKSVTATYQLLKCKDVDVNLKDKNNRTAFDLCSEWEDIPHHLFKIIKDKASADAQAQNEAT